MAQDTSIEAEIAECCRAIYFATEPDAALRCWSRLRELKAMRSQAELNLFNRETGRATSKAHHAGTTP